MTTTSSCTALPDDVLQRVLLGVARDDRSRGGRCVIRGPRFLRLRRVFAET